MNANDDVKVQHIMSDGNKERGGGGYSLINTFRLKALNNISGNLLYEQKLICVTFQNNKYGNYYINPEICILLLHVLRSILR